jgi:hypothetical protein
VRHSHDIAEVEQGLLGHTEVDEVGLEFVELPGEAYFMQGINRKLRVGAGQGSKILVPHFPGVVGLHEYRITVVVVDILQMLNKPVEWPAGASTPNTCVDDNMLWGTHGCYNYNQ